MALGCYFAGLCGVVAGALFLRSEAGNVYFGLGRAAVASGFLFQFVGLIESMTAAPLLALNIFRLIASLLAFVVAAFFLAVYRRHSPRALSLVIAPLLCLLAAAASFAPVEVQSGPSPLAQSLLHNHWIYIHILLICLGYAGLVIAMASGGLYLIAERSLKSKHRPIGAPRSLPPLEVLDQLGYRVLLAGFPLLTAGLVIGAYWANALFGRISLADPTVLLAVLAWAIYLVLLFARWSAGWRGRRTAYLTLVCFAVAFAGWLANGHSFMHSLFLK